MIENELLFLGLLAEGPKHAYEIKRQIEEDLAPNIGLRIKSIYYPLQKMAGSGLIDKETGRQGRWPQKYVYRITPKGKRKFDLLIEESFLSIERPFFQMNLSLYFMHLTDKSRAKRRLRTRLGLLKRISRGLAVLKEKSFAQAKSGRWILQHDLDLVEAEIASTQKLVHQL